MSIYNGCPYTYLIGWSEKNIWYYGVEYKRGCSPENLWVKYFTSSEYVHKFVKEHGNPDIIQVRKTFETPEAAKLWERKVLMKIYASGKWENWLNKSITPNYIPIFDDDIKEKMSIAKIGNSWNKDRKHSAETRKRMGRKLGCIPWNKGKKIELSESGRASLCKALSRPRKVPMLFDAFSCAKCECCGVHMGLKNRFCSRKCATYFRHNGPVG